jgi:hypothetical protein
LRADRLPAVEVDGERVAGEAVVGAGLMRVVGPDRGDQPHVVVGAAVGDVRGGGVAGVHGVLAGERAPVGEHPVDRLGHRRIRDRGVVVATFVIRFGGWSPPSSEVLPHVSLMCTV